jgi:hypothetical protein
MLHLVPNAVDGPRLGQGVAFDDCRLAGNFSAIHCCVAAIAEQVPELHVLCSKGGQHLRYSRVGWPRAGLQCQLPSLT